MDIKVDEHTVIVFDLDDTLYNELDYLKSAYKYIAKTFQPKDWKPLYSKMFSLYRSNHNVFEYVAKSHNVAVEDLIDIYRDHNPDIQLFDGVIKVLLSIKSKKGKIGIITDGRSKTQRTKIESLGISDYIDKIIISEEIGSEKPCIDNFKAIENSLTGSVYYYIADNIKKDFIAPKELGWKSVALIDNGKNIHFESHKYMTIENLPEDYIFDISELNVI